MNQNSITQTMVTYALTDHWKSFSEKEISLLKTAITDWIAAAYSGRNQECVKILLELAAENNGFGDNRVIGQSERCTVSWAALLNGMESHALDFDDIHATLPLHLTTPVCSAALPVAEAKGKTGRAFLSAVMNGMQIIAAISAAVDPMKLRKHWHCTGTLGIFGATAACAYLLELTPEQLGCAFGIAASKASGLLLNKGTMAKPLQAAQAAQAGLEAAQMAAKGFTACADVFDSSYLADTYGEAQLENMLDRLNGGHVIAELRYKRYPCGVPTHSEIINSRILAQENNIDIDRIESIIAEPYPDAIRLVGIQYPETGLRGKFSIPFVIAAQLVFGKVTEDTFTDEILHDARVQALLPKVTMKPNPEFTSSRGGKLTINMADGHTYSHAHYLFTDHIDAEEACKSAHEKFFEQAEKHMNHEQAENILFEIEKLDYMPDVLELTSTLI